MHNLHQRIRWTASKLLRLNSSGTKRAEKRSISGIAFLKSWNVDEFRDQAFKPQLPYCLPKSIEHTPAACQRWFSTGNEDTAAESHERGSFAVLNLDFWHQYADTVVPLEVTSKDPQDESRVRFERVTAPLGLLLQHVQSSSSHNISIYLAQHDLRDLPEHLQNDLPTPNIVKLVGRGDIYSSSLWLGRSPTYTPLHRDPNPNLFIQLAGSKAIRLFRPDVGTAIFEHTRLLMATRLNNGDISAAGSSISPTFRGEEMMHGIERYLLHELVWADGPLSKKYEERIMVHAQEATLASGQALFIPKGWWHSVKGTGMGVTASANWWFR